MSDEAKTGKDPVVEYIDAVGKHLSEEFPPTSPPPPLLNIVAAEWAAAVAAKVPPPAGMGELEIAGAVSSAVVEFFEERGYVRVGEIWSNEDRLAEKRAADEQAAREKAAREVEPLRMLIRDVLVEVLTETGLVTMKPTAVRKPVVHPTKRGPGRR